MIGWDVTALGLPASDQPFVAGRFTQSIELPGRWLERGTVRGDDPGAARLAARLGRPAHPGDALVRRRRGDRGGAPRGLLDAARAACDAHPLGRHAGATAVDPGVIVVRVLAPRVEPAMDLLAAIWRAWRPLAWQLEASPPRVWRT